MQMFLFVSYSRLPVNKVDIGPTFILVTLSPMKQQHHFISFLKRSSYFPVDLTGDVHLLRRNALVSDENTFCNILFLLLQQTKLIFNILYIHIFRILFLRLYGIPTVTFLFIQRSLTHIEANKVFPLFTLWIFSRSVIFLKKVWSSLRDIIFCAILVTFLRLELTMIFVRVKHSRILFINQSILRTFCHLGFCVKHFSWWMIWVKVSDQVPPGFILFVC